MTSVRPAPVGVLLKKIFRVKRQVIETQYGNYFLDPASNLGLTVIESGSYEPEITQAMVAYLKEGDVCFDVGANEGYHTVVASKLVGNTGKVIAIEPQNRVLPILRRNLEANGCQNVHVVEMAISDNLGEANLHLTASVNTGPSSLEPNNKYPLPTQTVKTTTLGCIFDEYEIEHCSLMKMDIEGFEHEAVFGAAELFKTHRIRTLAIEPTDRLLQQRGHSAQDIASFLRDCGYQLDVRFANDFYRQVWTV